MKMKITTIIILQVVTLFATLNQVKSQEPEKLFNIGGDIVSSYVWRGIYQTGVSAQPAMALNIKNFSLSAWGNIGLSANGFKEVDFTASYTFKGFQVAVTDYWWEGENQYHYFVYGSHRTCHHFEGTLNYTLPVEKFPLSLSWNTMFAGSDYCKSNGKRAYSSYFELGYPCQLKDISLDASLGITPYEGLYAKNFSVINIGLKASKSLKITDSFALPIFTQLIVNPQQEDIHFVFGVSL